MKKLLHNLSIEFGHWFHVVSNVRPLVWMCVYVILIPIFAFIYWGLPEGQFRIPDGGGTDFGSWIYYSIVTITTLGFGDYTPAHAGAQAVTAIEVTCGLLCMGFFLNSVGSMKGEIDVTMEIEKQRRLHQLKETEKLTKTAPIVLRVLGAFITTSQNETNVEDQKLQSELAHSAARVSLTLDSFQNRVDLSLWPELMEKCFAFVANYQILASDITSNSCVARTSNVQDNQLAPHPALSHTDELKAFLKENIEIAQIIESKLNEIIYQSH